MNSVKRAILAEMYAPRAAPLSALGLSQALYDPGGGTPSASECRRHLFEMEAFGLVKLHSDDSWGLTPRGEREASS